MRLIVYLTVVSTVICCCDVDWQAPWHVGCISETRLDGAGPACVAGSLACGVQAFHPSAFAGSRSHVLVGASPGPGPMSPVRQAAQPTQQTAFPYAHQHSPAGAVPAVAQAAFQGHVPHASPVVKINLEDQVATYARMQDHLHDPMPRHFHIPEGATEFVPGGRSCKPSSSDPGLVEFRSRAQPT